MKDLARISLKDALAIARNLKYGPLANRRPDTQITTAEALSVIQEALKTCGFSWITGQEARKVLKAHLNEK
jgi:hypothetical protein